jgi:hypothetical protein
MSFYATRVAGSKISEPARENPLRMKKIESRDFSYGTHERTSDAVFDMRRTSWLR